MRTADCGLRIADCGLRIADCGKNKAKYHVHNFILTKFQHKFQFFISKYVFQTQNEVPILINFMNKLLFPILTEWIVQFTVHAFDTANRSYRLFFFYPKASFSCQTLYAVELNYNFVNKTEINQTTSFVP